jgi:hypothetical protein
MSVNSAADFQAVTVNTTNTQLVPGNQYIAFFSTIGDGGAASAVAAWGYKQEGSFPDDLAFLAMARHQLGQKDEAKATLARLREVLKPPRRGINPDAAGFLREAEELIEGKAKDKGR